MAKDPQAPKGSRFTHPRDYTGPRTRGRAMGTLWWSSAQDGGDVTLRLWFDEMSVSERYDMLTDVLGMLQREMETLVWDNPGLALLPEGPARDILTELYAEEQVRLAASEGGK